MRPRHDRTIARRFALAVALLALGAAAEAVRAQIDWAAADPIPLAVDATDIARRLVHTDMRFPARTGVMDFYFVEWTPGNHNPSGPIQNVVNLFFEDGRGRRLDWRRDPRDIVRFSVDVPAGVSQVRVRFTYIADQPSVNSRSTDTYGEPTLGALNWNTVLLYPADASKLDIRYQASLTLPAGWRHASALSAQRIVDNAIAFAPVSLAELVDSPVIFGEHLRTYRLPAPGLAPHYIDAVAPEPEQVEIGEHVLDAIADMLVEAERVFGPFPRDEYHFLLVVSDDTPGFGVEHDRSTFIGLSGSALKDANEKGAASLGVIAHEYTHAWNGKLRAPAGLHSLNYHDDKDASLLWVYEGMTSYYDEVLAVRSGMQNFDDFAHNLTNSIARYEQQTGRLWRSVADTARGMRVLRAPSPAWADLRRRQDYYGEGALFWADADARIRRGTQGERSLDDFCRSFFGVKPGPRGSHVEYTRSDIVDALAAVYPGEDWDARIRLLIETPPKSLAIELPALLGYRLDSTSEPTERQKRDEGRGGGLNLRASIGFSVNREGEIVSIVPGSAADDAKVAYGMKILAVGDRPFSIDALRDAIGRTDKTGGATLFVEFGDRMRELRVSYAGGLRYPALVREDAPGPDLLAAIAHK